MKNTVCPVTGFCDILLYFDIGNGLTSDKRSFRDEAAAQRYVYSTKTTYILLKLERYVNKQHRLFNDFEIYNTRNKRAALNTCLLLLQKVQNLPLTDILKTVMKVETELDQLLPGTKSIHFISSHELLTEIIAFCKSELLIA